MSALVLAGAGHAHVEVLRRFGRRPLPGVEITIVTPAQHTPYTGMLPGLVAGHYAFADAHIDVAALARRIGTRLVLDEVIGLDVAGRRVLCADGAALPFDTVSLDVGSRPNTGGVPGAAEHAIAVKPIGGFLARFEGGVLARVRAGRSRHLALVGGGAGGVELMLAVAHRLRREAPAMRFTLITGSAEILPHFPAGFRARLVRILSGQGIAVRAGCPVTAVGRYGVTLRTGEAVLADEVLWTTQAAPPGWLAGTGQVLDEGGFLRVDAYLQAMPGVFAAGDMIAFGPGGIARSGVNAVRAAPVLAANLRAALVGGRRRRFYPPGAALAIVSAGGRYAVATRNGVSAEGAWAWRLKDLIDRRYMERFR